MHLTPYRKAVMAAVIGILTEILVAVQAALSNGISTSELVTIAIVALGAVGSTFGVYQIPNEPLD